MPDTIIDTVLTDFAAAAVVFADAVNAAQSSLGDDSRAAVLAVFATFLKLVDDLNTGKKGVGPTTPNAAATNVRDLFAQRGADDAYGHPTFKGGRTQWLIEAISSHANAVLAELTAYAGGTAPGYSGTYNPAHGDWAGPDAPVD